MIATAVAVFGIVIPPIGLASALVAIGFSAVAWRRARRRGDTNTVARACLLGCVTLIVVVVGGSAIYAQG